MIRQKEMTEALIGCVVSPIHRSRPEGDALGLIALEVPFVVNMGRCEVLIAFLELNLCP
jgi:hypothetical protein